MNRKSEILSKAQALWEIGMTETVQPLWVSDATDEAHIAPMLDALGRELEGALRRISAASCYQKKKYTNYQVLSGFEGCFLEAS